MRAAIPRGYTLYNACCVSYLLYCDAFATCEIRTQWAIVCVKCITAVNVGNGSDIHWKFFHGCGSNTYHYSLGQAQSGTVVSGLDACLSVREAMARPTPTLTFSLALSPTVRRRHDDLPFTLAKRAKRCYSRRRHKQRKTSPV